MFVLSSVLAVLGTGRTAEGFSGSVFRSTDSGAHFDSYVQAGVGEAGSYEDANVENGFIGDSAVLGSRHSVTDLGFGAGGSLQYKTRGGDGIQTLAAQFGVSSSSLMGKNSGLRSAKTIKPGTMITIPAR